MTENELENKSRISTEGRDLKAERTESDLSELKKAERSEKVSTSDQPAGNDEKISQEPLNEYSDGERIDEPGSFQDSASKDIKSDQGSGSTKHRSLDDFRGRTGRSGRGNSGRGSDILRLNHPEYRLSDMEEADGAKSVQSDGKPSTDSSPSVMDSSVTELSSNEESDGKITDGSDMKSDHMDQIEAHEKVTAEGPKSAKISVEETGSDKVSAGEATLRKDKILSLNSKWRKPKKTGGNAMKAAPKSGKKAAGAKGAAGVSGIGTNPVFAAVFPIILVLVIRILYFALRIIIPVILIVLIGSSLLPENPYDLGVDKATYLVTKYHGDESKNILSLRTIGTFSFSEDEDIQSLIDYLVNERNEDGMYDSLSEYTSDETDSYTLLDRIDIRRTWLALDLHLSKLLQDQQRYMIDRYYLEEEEWIEGEYEIDLSGASYALKGAILSMNFIYEEDDREELYDGIEWTSDTETKIIEKLYDNAMSLTEDEDLIAALTLESWDACSMLDGSLYIYENDSNRYGSISWSGHESALLGLAPEDNLRLSEEPGRGIVSTVGMGASYTVSGGIAGSDIFGPVTGGGYYLDSRMPYLFPAGVPNSPQEMGQYLVDVPCETCNRGIVYITIHRLLAEKVQTAFHEMAEIGFPIDGDTYGYGWRAAVTVTSSGQSFRSHHSYGVVVDINPNKNCMVKNGVIISGAYWLPGEDPYSVTQEVVDIWKKQGFLWGGEFPDSRDYMHFTFTGH